MFGQKGLAATGSGKDERQVEMAGDVVGHDLPDVYDPNDPKNWSWIKKNSILLCISILGFLGTYNSSLVVGAYAALATQFHTEIEQETYLVGVCALLLGIGPLVWNPFAQTHGRRSVYVVSTFVSLMGVIWCAASNVYASMVLGRILAAFGLSAVHALGGVTVADLFEEKVRGSKVGIWVVFTILGVSTTLLMSSLKLH